MNKTEPVITHGEILRRAMSDLLREKQTLERAMAVTGLPEACFADEQKALDAKIYAVNAMRRYECGDYFV